MQIFNLILWAYTWYETLWNKSINVNNSGMEIFCPLYTENVMY
jgi:hypothetical protein